MGRQERRPVFLHVHHILGRGGRLFALRASLKAWINCSAIYFALPFFAPVVIPFVESAFVATHDVTSYYVSISQHTLSQVGDTYSESVCVR